MNIGYLPNVDTKPQIKSVEEGVTHLASHLIELSPSLGEQLSLELLTYIAHYVTSRVSEPRRSGG